MVFLKEWDPWTEWSWKLSAISQTSLWALLSSLPVHPFFNFKDYSSSLSSLTDWWFTFSLLSPKVAAACLFFSWVSISKSCQFTPPSKSQEDTGRWMDTCPGEDIQKKKKQNDATREGNMGKMEVRPLWKAGCVCFRGTDHVLHCVTPDPTLLSH